MRKQRLNSGQMRDRIEKYEFKDGRLVLSKSFWGRAELKKMRCIYSERGTASPDTLSLDFYKSVNLTPANVIKFSGRWWAVGFCTGEESRIYAHADCGGCTVSEFSFESKIKSLDEFNTPTLIDGESIIFDGILCEKYIRAAEGERFFEDAREYVVIYPKEITLPLSGTILANGRKYTVTQLHDGVYLNEATVVYRGDV